MCTYPLKSLRLHAVDNMCHGTLILSFEMCINRFLIQWYAPNNSNNPMRVLKIEVRNQIYWSFVRENYVFLLFYLIYFKIAYQNNRLDWHFPIDPTINHRTMSAAAIVSNAHKKYYLNYYHRHPNLVRDVNSNVYLNGQFFSYCNHVPKIWWVYIGIEAKHKWL